MLQGIYTASASLAALERCQETISQNLAAGPNCGYRKLAFSTEAVTAGKFGRVSGELPQTTVGTSFAAGEVQETTKPTDVAIQGEGFFQVKAEDGKTLYTRDGEFHVSAEGQLVTKRGWQVQGEGGPLQINPEAGPITISKAGEVVQGEVVVGKLPLVHFQNPERLQRAEAGYFQAPEDLPAEPVAAPALMQGFIEGGNCAPLSEMVNMVTVARAYEASQKVITSQDELMKSAISSLGDPI